MGIAVVSYTLKDIRDDEVSRTEAQKLSEELKRVLSYGRTFIFYWEWLVTW